MNNSVKLCRLLKFKNNTKKKYILIIVSIIFSTVVLFTNFESTAKDVDIPYITSFKIEQQIGKTIINDENHTIDISMPYETSLCSLTPSIELSQEDAKVSPGSGIMNDFSNPSLYTVTDKNGNKITYTVTIKTPKIPINLFAMKSDVKKAIIKGVPDSCKQSTSDLAIKLKFGRYCNKDVQWYIAGANDKTATLYSKKILLDTKSFLIKTNQSFTENKSRQWLNLNEDIKNSIYYQNSPKDDYKISDNHYGASSIRASLKNLETYAFGELEKKIIKPTVLSLTDNFNENYTLKDNLFLPEGTLSTDSLKKYKIQVSDDTGNFTYDINTSYTPYQKPNQSENNNDFEIYSSWLRTPSDDTSKVLVVGGYESANSNNLFIQQSSVINGYGLVPACNIDINSLYFLSAAPNGVLDKYITISNDEKSYDSTDENDLMTFRYKDENVDPEYTLSVSDEDKCLYSSNNESISVKVKSENNEDDLSNYNFIIQGCETEKNYLSSENKNWVYETRVNKNGKATISLKDISGNWPSVSLDECRVWIEKNNGGMIYASTPKIIQAKPKNAPTVASISEVDENCNVKVVLDTVEGQQYACVKKNIYGNANFENCNWDNGEGEFSLQIGNDYLIVSRYMENGDKLPSLMSEKTELTIKSDFDITYSCGIGGIIKPYKEWDPEENSCTSNSTEEQTCNVKIGESQWFSIIPDKGKQIKDIKVDNQSVGKYSVYKFDNIKSDHKIEVFFEKEKSCWVKDLNDNWRYKQGEGSDINIKTWVEGIDIDGNKSMFAVGWINDSKFIDKPRWFYCDEDGYLETGWIREPKDTNANQFKWYYLNTNETGTLGQMLLGWFTDDDGSRYFFNNKVEDEETVGQMEVGWIEFPEGSNQWYYMNDDESNNEENLGKMLVGWYTAADGKTYYLNENNTNEENYGKMQIGWLELNGDKYYFNAKGIMLTGRQRIAGKIYIFGSDGKLQVE